MSSTISVLHIDTAAIVTRFCKLFYILSLCCKFRAVWYSVVGLLEMTVRLTMEQSILTNVVIVQEINLLAPIKFQPVLKNVNQVV
jgi:hypothetical protein